MKKTALALVSTLLLVAACDSSSSDNGTAGGAGGAAGTGMGVLGTDASGNSIGDRVFFALDSSVIDADGQAALAKQAEWLKQYGSVNVTLEGHCDERGTREYNLALGERRAAAAKAFLMSQGIASSRISTISYGKERPAATGNDESAWSQNRRAVTVLAQ